MKRLKLILASLIMFTGVSAAASNCGGTPPKCPLGYVADKDTHGNWGCYPSR